MKVLEIAVLLALLLGGIASLLAQSNKKDHLHLLAVQLDSDLAKLFLKEAKCAAYKIDNEGVLRPQKGYSMAYYFEEELIELKPVRQDEPVHSIIGNYEEVPLPGGKGKIACYCDDGSDDCAFEKTNEHGPDRDDFICTGSCSCGIGVILLPDRSMPILQTPDGNWHNFDNMPSK